MKKALKNIIAVSLSDVLSRLLGFGANAYLARVLGTFGFGAMSVGLSVLSYAAMLSSPGVQVAGTRHVATTSEHADNYVSNVNSLRCALAMGCALIVGVVSWIFIHPASTALAVFIFSLSAIPMALSLDWYFLGRENLLASSGSKVVVAGIYLVFIFFLVRSEGDIIWTAVAFLIANILATAWLLYLYGHSGPKFHFTVRLDEWKKLVRQSLPLGISSFLAQTIMNSPVLIVGAIISSHAAGLFNAAMKLIFFALMIDRVFNAMFFPVISRHRATDMEQFKHTGALALKIVLAASVPVVVAGSVFAGETVRFVYGASFIDASVPFQILLLYFLFSVMNTVFMSVMIADNREAEYLRIMAGGTAVLVVLCVILSFTYGLVGASAAVAIGEGSMTVLLLAKGKSNVFQKLWKLITPAIVSGVLMLGVLLLLNSWTMFLAAPVGLVVFGIALWLLKGISGEEILFLRGRFL